MDTDHTAPSGLAARTAPGQARTRADRRYPPPVPRRPTPKPFPAPR
jgi:hypothetical protein